MKRIPIFNFLMGLLMINPIMATANVIEPQSDKHNITPKIYDSVKLYELYLEGLRQQKQTAYIESLFSKAYLLRHSGDKSYIDNKIIACKRYELEDKFTQHHRSQLNYVITQICNPFFPTLMHKVYLKKERNTGWMIDDITEFPYQEKQDRPVYKAEHDYVFAEYATGTVFDDYVNSVRKGDSWNVYKKYHTDAFVINTENSTKNLTEKQRQSYENLNQHILNCQKFIKLSQKTEGTTHTTVYQYTDQCSESDSINYRQVTFKYNDSAWKIDKMTMSGSNTFSTIPHQYSIVPK